MLIRVINEVDVFVDDKKRFIKLEKKQKAQNLLFMERVQGHNLKDTTKIQVHVNDILAATTIYNFFTTKPQTINGANFEKEYRFVSERPNHRPKQIMLKFTSFVGNESIAVAEAFLPSSSANELQPQTSLGNSLVRAITGGVSDSNEHFVATIVLEAVDSRVAPTIATRVQAVFGM